MVLQCTVWWQYARACGWWGAAYSGAAVVAQTLATAADFWLMRTTADHAEHPLSSEQVKVSTDIALHRIMEVINGVKTNFLKEDLSRSPR